MMSQQFQAANSSPADLPMKRKRGRPRKDESLLQGENMNTAVPGSDAARKNKPSASTGEKVEDDMVGQVVSGVIEGSFDAGYLLNVKVGDTDTQLRGVVFLPGRFIPITPTNDVAPHVPMWQRKEIPIPAPGSASQSRLSKNPSMELSAPAFSSQVPPFEVQSSPAETASGKQPASVTPSPADNFPRNETSPSFVETATKQPTSESGLEISISEQNNAQAAEFDNGALTLKDHVPSYKLDSGNPTVAPLNENLPKNDMFPPFDHKMISQQTLESGLEIPPAEHTMKNFLVQPAFPGEAPRLGVQPAVSMAFDGQSASISLPLIDNFARNDRGSSLEGEAVLQQISDSGFQAHPSMELKNLGVFPNQDRSFGIQSSHTMELDNQPAAFTTVAVNSSKNDTPSPSEGKPMMPQQASESEFGISSTIQDYNQSLELNSNAPAHPEQISPFALQLGTYTALDKHTTSEFDTVPPGNVTFPSWERQLVSQPTLEFGLEIHPFEQGHKQQQQQPTFHLQSANSLKNDRGPFMESQGIPQQNLFSGFENQSKYDKAVEHDQVLHEFESSNLIKSPTFQIEGNKDAELLQPASEPSAEIEFQHQDANSEFKLNAFINEEAKNPNMELGAEETCAGNDLGLRIGCEAAADRQNL